MARRKPRSAAAVRRAARDRRQGLVEAAGLEMVCAPTGLLSYARSLRRVGGGSARARRRLFRRTMRIFDGVLLGGRWCVPAPISDVFGLVLATLIDQREQVLAGARWPPLPMNVLEDYRRLAARAARVSVQLKDSSIGGALESVIRLSSGSRNPLTDFMAAAHDYLTSLRDGA